MVAINPFYSRIPKRFEANLEWRRDILRDAEQDHVKRAMYWDACKKDPLFWVNAFVWTYDPRREPFAKVPMITYRCQDDVFMEIVGALGKHDLLVEKSRDMGASWLCSLAITHSWQFDDWKSYLFVSRTANYVDQTGNPKSLFWKFDFTIDNMPWWLIPNGYSPDKHRKLMHARNPETNSVIDGESTTGHVAQGDRRTAILLDEFALVDEGFSVLAATRDVTRSRIFNSTPNGTANAYYKMATSDIKKARLHWSNHPDKAVGLYTKRGKEYEALDEIYWAGRDEPEREMEKLDLVIGSKGVVLSDGKMRSVWYAEQCERSAHASEIAEQLDIDYMGSSYQFFSAPIIEQLITRHCYPPHLIGDIEYDTDTLRLDSFRPDPRGRLSLWCYLDHAFKPPGERLYCIGADVSAGTGASDSSLAIYDGKTKEKVGSYVNPNIRPEEFGRYSVAVCNMFHNAFLTWEDAGPGTQFGAAVVDSGYRNVYLRRAEKKLSRRKTDTPGFAPAGGGKKACLSSLRAALETGEWTDHEEAMLRETLEFIHLPNGSIEHSRAARTIDPTGSKDNHGDRVMAAAMAWVGYRDRMWGRSARNPDRKAESNLSLIEERPSCFAARRHRYKQTLKPAFSWE